MATSTQNNDGTRLLDLPSELLQMIFRAVFAGQNLVCRHNRSNNTVTIARPSSMIVSKCYLAEAKNALLVSEGVVDLELEWEGCDWENVSFSPEFQLIQHLKVPEHIYHSGGTPKAENVVRRALKAAPQLKSLTFTLASSAEYDGHWKWGVDAIPNRFIVLSEGTGDHSKSILKFAIALMEWRPILAGELSKRAEAFKVYVETRITAEHLAGDAPQQCRLSASANPRQSKKVMLTHLRLADSYSLHAWPGPCFHPRHRRQAAELPVDPAPTEHSILDGATAHDDEEECVNPVWVISGARGQSSRMLIIEMEI
ncbi:uncharacterized protein AB675_7284 [Cyphellophora attinorum]|uniref:Uncharacterized protein n=1 Tax=Cyphellophora attinorum TaxID=1664694 RepID=A0A0N1HN23_9EURO|nr:uncharacterized protein AB675_7284 [Phialophora attinorum]KPI36316.1 hypothetical protein AB675_7284 [Phialophora attinorum]